MKNYSITLEPYWPYVSWIPEINHQSNESPVIPLVLQEPMLIISLNENSKKNSHYLQCICLLQWAKRIGKKHVNYYVSRQQQNMAIQYTKQLLLFKKLFWFIQYDADCMEKFCLCDEDKT